MAHQECLRLTSRFYRQSFSHRSFSLSTLFERNAFYQRIASLRPIATSKPVAPQNQRLSTINIIERSKQAVFPSPIEPQTESGSSNCRKRSQSPQSDSETSCPLLHPLLDRYQSFQLFSMRLTHEVSLPLESNRLREFCAPYPFIDSNRAGTRART